MKKIIIVIIGMLLFAGVAYGNLEKITVPITVKFDDNNSFRVITEDGNNLKYFHYGNTVSDNETWNIDVYRNITQIDASRDYLYFQNMTLAYQDVLEVCKDNIHFNNDTRIIANEYSLCREERENQKVKLEQCTIDRDNYKTKSDQYDGCVSQKKTYYDEKTVCETQLKELEEEEGSVIGFIIAGIVGLGAGYLIWNKKKDAPPEHQELGEDPGGY